MTAILCELAMLAIVVITASASDGHCTSFRRRSLQDGDGPTRPSCPGPTSNHTQSGTFNRNVTAPSAVMCGLICMRDGICESFRYCKDQNICQLNTALQQETVTTMRSTGCVLFDKEIQEEHKEEVTDASSTSVAPVTDAPSTSVAPVTDAPSTTVAPVTDAPSTSVIAPCEWTRTTAPGEFVQIPSALPEPLRLEFKAETSDIWPNLIFSANTPGKELYQVAIRFDKSYIQVMENGWETEEIHAGSFIGSFIVITINGGLISVDVQGDGPSYSYQDPYPPQVTSWYVTFGGTEYETTCKWHFIDPCDPF